MNKRAVIIGGSIVVVAGVIGLATLGGVFASRAPEITYLTAESAVMDVRDTVSISGSLKPVETVGLAFGEAPVRSPSASATAGMTGASPWTVWTVDVKEGDRVKKGDELAAADTKDAELALAAAQANLAAAEVRLANDKRPVNKTSKAQAQLGVTQASKQVSQAKKAQSQTQASGRLAISQANGALADAKKQLAADVAAGAPEAVLDADRAAVKQASNALASTKQQVLSANTQAANAVQSAQLALQSARLNYTAATTVDTDALVAADEAAIAQAKVAVSNAQATLDRATLIAPMDGVVASVDIAPGDSATGIVIVLRTGDLKVNASVTESDLPSMKVGQPAMITIKALDQSVAGKVDSIDLAGATTSPGGVVSYDLVIAPDSLPDLAVPGMSTDVDVTTAEVKGVIAVPATAIGGTAGAYTVDVMDASGTPRTVPVEVGLLTPEWAEIRSGIDAGTVVVTGTASTRDQVTTFPGAGGPPRGAGGGSAPSSAQP